MTIVSVCFRCKYSLLLSVRVIASSFILVFEEGRASWAQFPVCFRGLTQSTTEFHCWKEGLVHLDKKKKDFQKYEGTKVAK